MKFRSRVKHGMTMLGIKNAWPFYLILLTVFIYFWKVILLGKIPIPADITTGVYLPWLDYKWGYAVGVPVKNPIMSDVVSVIYPLRIFAVEQIKSGILPLWNPFMFSGYPLLANFQIAIFAPTFFLYFIFDKLTAWSLQVILQPILGAFFSYLLLRNFKLGKFPSVVGGLIYAFSGFNVIWQQWNAHALTAAFIPLILLLTDKLIFKFKIKYAVLLSISVALLIFSGYPQLLVYTFMSAGLLMLFRKVSLKRIFIIGVFLILGVFLSAVQTLPAFELVGNSQRLTEFLARDFALVPYRNLISFVSPDFFGNHATKNFWGLGDYTNNVGYTGLVAIVLSTIAIISSWKKTEVKYLTSLLVLTLVLATRNPIAELFYSMKIHGSTAASAARMLIIANLALAFLSSFGLEKLLNNKSKKIYLYSTFLPFGMLLIAGYWGFQLENNVALRNLILPSAILFTISSLLIARKFFKNKYANYLVVILISILAIAELFRFGWKFNPFVKRELVFPPTAITSFLKDLEKPNRVYVDNVIPMNMWVPYGIESPGGYDAVYPRLTSEYVAIANSLDSKATPMSRLANASNVHSKLLLFANMKYAIFSNNITKNLKLPKNLVRIFDFKSVSVYKNTKAHDRAFVVYNWEETSNDDVFVKMLNKNTDLRKKAFIENGNRSRVAAQDDSVAGEYNINYKKYSANESILDVETSEYGLLVVSDTYYPGWRAYVDGERVEIIKTNHAFRGIEISKGKHEVRFIYDPISIKIGVVASLSVIIILLGLLLNDNKK